MKTLQPEHFDAFMRDAFKPTADSDTKTLLVAIPNNVSTGQEKAYARQWLKKLTRKEKKRRRALCW